MRSLLAILTPRACPSVASRPRIFAAHLRLLFLFLPEINRRCFPFLDLALGLAMESAAASAAASSAVAAAAAASESEIAATERRGKELSKRLLSRWANLFLGSALLLSIALPNLLSPPDVWLNDARWSSTLWYPTVYGVLWGGASLHALLTLLSCLVLANTIGSASPGDVEAIITTLGTEEIAAQQCLRRKRLPVLTSVFEVMLAVVVLGTSWRPPVLLAPAVFFRPCLLFFFLATTFAVYFRLPLPAFIVFCAMLVIGTGIALGATRTVHLVVNELATEGPHARVTSTGLVIPGKPRHLHKKVSTRFNVQAHHPAGGGAAHHPHPRHTLAAATPEHAAALLGDHDAV